MSNYYNRQWRLPNNENKDKQSNYSMDFDGSQKITLNSSIQLTTNKSISVWCYVEPTVNQNTLLGGDAFPIYYFWLDNPNSKIYIRDSSGITQLSTGTLSEGWTHFCITSDGTTATLYVNGVSTSTGTDRELDIRAIGGYVTGSTYFFNGKSDAVAIFNYTLSSSQVTTLYGSSSTGIGNPMSLSPKPVAYYPLGDQDAFNGASYLTPNASLKDYVFSFAPNSYINIPDLSSLRVQNLTVSFWVNAGTQGSNYKYFLEKGSFSYVVYTSSTTTDLFFFMYDGSSYYFSNALTNVLDSNWHHITFTYNGSQIIGYKDGVANTPVSASVTLLHDTNPLTIGGRSPSPGNYPTGKISNAQIFNTALPATGSNSVETLYNNGSPLTSMSGFTSLQGWWKLDASATYDGSNWTIPDDSSNSNDGTSSGMTQANLVQSDLSFTSGYSPYALDFDGTSDYIDFGNDSSLNISTSSYSISFWIKTNDSGITVISQKANDELAVWINNSKIQWNGANPLSSISLITGDVWKHVCLVTNSSNSYIYINGVEDATVASTQINSTTSSDNFRIGGRNTQYSYEGLLSNWAFYNTALTPAQVTEIYSEGIPQNLNNHSAVSSLVSWWQLGSNSSFNTNWTVLDEVAASGNNGTSVNMTEDDIVDGVGSYANGLSSGMGGDEVIGDAPYSTANSLSVNMDVLDRVTDTPS